MAFLADLAASLEPQAYAAGEKIHRRRTLHVVGRQGVVARHGRVLIHGMVWGDDMILKNDFLIDNSYSISLTTAECTCLALASLTR